MDAELPILMEAAYLYQTNKAARRAVCEPRLRSDTVDRRSMTRNPAFYSCGG